MIYVSANLEKFDSVSNFLSGKSSGKFRLKDFVFSKCNLQIFNKDKLEREIDDIQPLYLFPTTILDYIKLVQKTDKNLCPVKIFVNDFSNEFFENYKKLDSGDLKCYEFLINEKAKKYENEILVFVSQNDCYFSLNIKNLIEVSDEFLKRLAKKIIYFKIFLPEILGTAEYDVFLKKLKIISENKNEETLINIKTYLSEEQSQFYKNATYDFEALGVDIFQVSKKLLEVGEENKTVRQDVQTLVRDLEKQYDGKNGFKFLSVKDISILYYPRFELDERNTRNCYASKMCPYVFGNLVLPCKVQKVVSDRNHWKLFDLSSGESYAECSCGKNCDDCASMFENDTLQKINDVIADFKPDDLKFVIGVKDND